MSKSLTRILVVLALASPLSACKQALGDRCQLDSDCDSGLVCAVPSGARGAGGTCQSAAGTGDMGGVDLTNTSPPDFTGAIPVDMTPAPDLSMPDLTVSPDLTTEPDLTTPGDGAPAGG